jgi:hypothetical protein
MVFPNTVPIPNFSSTLPIPSSQAPSSGLGSNSGISQSSTSRKSKDNQNGLFNPPRRSFSVPVATGDLGMYDKIRKAILERNDRKLETNSESTTRDTRNNSSEQLVEVEKNRLELNVKALTKQTNEAEVTLAQAQQAAVKAQKDLLQAIKERDQELKTAKSTPIQSSIEDKGIQGMKKQQEELVASIQTMEEGLKETEEAWKNRYAEKKQQLEKDAEDKKRKASEQMEEQRRKNQRLDTASEISETQLLEKELKVCHAFLSLYHLRYLSEWINIALISSKLFTFLT